jgi:hypothetical protein
MSVDVTKIYRFPGQVTLGSDALGYTRSGAGSITFRPVQAKIPLLSEERGITKLGLVHGGYDVKASVELIQWDATTLKHLFPGLVSTTTVTINPSTTVPGTRLDQTSGYYYSFQFLSNNTVDGTNKLKVTATKICASIAPESEMFVGLGRDNSLMLDVDFMWDGTSMLWKIEFGT